MNFLKHNFIKTLQKASKNIKFTACTKVFEGTFQYSRLGLLLTSSAMVGTIWTADAPVPTTPTRFPLRSREGSHLESNNAHFTFGEQYTYHASTMTQ